jgi:hypothetical protein
VKTELEPNLIFRTGFRIRGIFYFYFFYLVFIILFLVEEPDLERTGTDIFGGNFEKKD